MFKVGDRVKVKLSGKTGTVEAVYNAEYWHLMAGGGDDEYTVKFDDDGSAVNIRESLLEFENVPKCECGLTFARSGGKHSDWCPMFTRD